MTLHAFFLRSVWVVFGALLLTSCGGAGQDGDAIPPGPEAAQQIQEQLITAPEGAVIELGEGTFTFASSLSVEGKKDLTIRGQGMDKTILSFADQQSGAEGIMAQNCPGLLLRDFAVQETKGDGFKIQDSKDVIMYQVKAEWLGEPDSANGAYGLYPVTCENLLVQGCESYGASDAGIYVGQSKHVIVRNCRAERNVAGIEIENTLDADVYNNVATNNTGGILIFDLPGLPQGRGGRINVFDNKANENNYRNFAPKGNIVASIPAGTGSFVLCCSDVRIFNNEIQNNRTNNAAIADWQVTQKPADDPDFKKIPDGVAIFDNTFAQQGGLSADTTIFMGKAIKMIRSQFQVKPDIIWTGMVNNRLRQEDGSFAREDRICVGPNGGATYFNLATGTTERKAVDCKLEPFPRQDLQHLIAKIQPES